MTFAIACIVDGEFAAEVIFLVILTGTILSLIQLGICRLADSPLAILVITPFAWVGSMSLWQQSLIGAIAIPVFDFSVPSFETIWACLPFVFLLLLVVELRNPYSDTKSQRCAMCALGLLSLLAIGYIRNTQISSSRNAPTLPCTLAPIDPDFVDEALASIFSSNIDDAKWAAEFHPSEN
ncbi:MAG: hypothetical protein AAGG48_28785 [Planctomycetota bacterium]